jgi:hypothetical protein
VTHGSVDLPFGGELRTFRLTPTKGWRVIQDKTGDGPPVVIRALAMAERPEAMPVLQWAMLGGMGTWKIDHVREVLLQGLIGGGENPSTATKLIVDYFDDAPTLPVVTQALQVCLASIMGLEGEEEPGEPKGEEIPASPTDASA